MAETKEAGMSETGRTAYEAFYAGLPRDVWDPWEKVAPDARAIWSRIERAVRAAADDEASKIRAALTGLVASMEGVDTPFTDAQEAAYEAAASLLDDTALSQDQCHDR